MSSTVANFFHFKRVMPMAAAARFGAFRNLFGHFHHHSRRHDHNHAQGALRATSGQHLESLRHASAMSSAILRNMSSSTAMGEPSHLMDHSSPSDFEERHRHYSFITVLAITSLFVLITISIVALILGFCRKSGSVFSLGVSGTATGSGGKDRRRSRADNVSQFELDSLDAELDDDDLETKACKDDPGGACYYHLSDDDDDDDIYDSDEDYFQINDAKNASDSENNPSRRKKRKQRGKRKLQKAKLRFRDSRYYYHLRNDDEDDDSCDDYSFHQRVGVGEDRDDGSPRGDSASTSLSLPKRSTTFPQLHSVLTSCIKGDSISSHQQSQSFKPSVTVSSSLSPPSSSSPPKASPSSKSLATSPCNDGCVASTANAAVYTPPSLVHNAKVTSSTNTSCDIENRTGVNTRNSQTRRCKTMTDPQNTFPNEYSRRMGRAGLVRPLPPHQARKNNTISKLNAKKLTVSTVPHHSRHTAFIPSKRRRRLFKSYSLHDIPHKGVNKITKSWCPPAWRPNILGVPCRQGVTSQHVTFKVGAALGDTDIRLHHV